MKGCSLGETVKRIRIYKKYFFSKHFVAKKCQSELTLPLELKAVKSRGGEIIANIGVTPLSPLQMISISVDVFEAIPKFKLGKIKHLK